MTMALRYVRYATVSRIAGGREPHPHFRARALADRDKRVKNQSNASAEQKFNVPGMGNMSLPA
jgi:hypothetical protein